MDIIQTPRPHTWWRRAGAIACGWSTAVLVAASFAAASDPKADASFVNELTRLGGRITSIENSDTLAVDLSESKISDAELAQLTRLGNVRLLKLPPSISDVGLVHVAGLTDLRELYLHDTRITDAGLAPLKRQMHLEQLHLNGTDISDAGLEHLAELTSLNVLNLTSTKVTDDGLVALKKLTQLEKLYIRATNATLAGVVHLYVDLQQRTLVDALDALDAVTRNDRGEPITIDVGGTEFSDEQLAHLKDVPTLEELHLSNTPITDAGMAHVAGLRGLKQLYLAKCDVGDEGLAHVRELVNLEALNVFGTKTTDAGIEHLMGLKHLRTLYITDLKLSSAVVDKLKQTLPQLKVTDFTAQ
jgi:Leucine-rich repeat (LRR) protein